MKNKRHLIRKKISNGVLVVGLLLTAFLIFTLAFYLENHRQNIKSKANENLCNLTWQCLGEIPRDDIKKIFGCNMYKWMKEKADNTHYQPPYDQLTGWYCLDECADQSVVTAFNGNKDLWMEQKSASKRLTKNDCFSYVYDPAQPAQEKPRVQEPLIEQPQEVQIPVQTNQPQTTSSNDVYVGKITSRVFPCAYSEIKGGVTVCYGGEVKDINQATGFNQNCQWQPGFSEEVWCPGVQQNYTNESRITQPTQTPTLSQNITTQTVAKKSIQNVAVIGDSMSSSSFAYHQILKNKLNLSVMDVFASVGAQTGWSKGGEGCCKGMSQQLNEMLSTGINYDYVIVFGGVNDLTSGVALETTKSNLQNIYSTIHFYGVKVIAITVLPWKDYIYANDYVKRNSIWSEKTQSLNYWISTYAQNIDIFIDAYWYFGDPSDYEVLNRDYSAGDGLHLNSTGQNKLAELISSKL